MSNYKLLTPWYRWLLTICLGLLVFACSEQQRPEKRILVFTKTAGFHHESIPDGIAALQKLGKENNFIVDTTENSDKFNENNLSKYSGVVFLNTTGNVFNFNQQNALERYIQAGGGFVGIHSATDTEYNWPWYNKLVGAYFESHPDQQKATIKVTDKNHPATQHLPTEWNRFDEWYNFKSINPDVNVIALLDEKTYKGGKNGDKHPFAWYHEYDGGRAFYTAGGHTSESYSEEAFLKHILGGIQYAIGENKEPNYSQVSSPKVPEANRFSKVVLAEGNLDEPMELAVAKDEKVFFVERKGKVKMYDPQTKKATVIGSIPVSTKYNNGKEAEDGLLGIALAPGFDQNKQIYLFYSPAGSVPKQHVSRFTLNPDYTVNMASEKVVLEIPVQRDQCCHSGGSLAFDRDGNLFISIGDNTNPFESNGYSPSDERPGRSAWDAQKSSANMNDLRGKILRIHPEANGTYTIPYGNLFPKDGSQGRPEIYAMGLRNPYRIAIDDKRYFLYWGDVGPDARIDSIQGPRGHDEVNQARKPGFFGWPYFVGDNKAYSDVNFATGQVGAKYDPKAPVNNSPNNTGGQQLPPAQKAFIYYPYDESPDFPDLGTGGRTAMAGPTYYYNEYADSDVKFPKFYDGALIIYEWMRNWIMAVRLDEQGNFVRMEPVATNIKMEKPGDMQFGPNGDLYALEYGTNWFAQNEDAKLIKIQFTEGNRPPVVIASADHIAGGAPLKVKFTSEGSTDYDGDKISYDWRFNGKKINSSDPNPEFTFEKPGIYPVTLTATDSKGRSSEAQVMVKVGNSVPNVAVRTKGNSTFFWDNAAIDYQVEVEDKEDGSLKSGKIDPSGVKVFVDYLPEGYDMVDVLGHQTKEAEVIHPGLEMMSKSDCKACHAVDKKSIGPSFVDIAKKYEGDEGAVVRLANKVIKGGGGVWGEQAMSAHPQLSTLQAQTMVEYIMTLAKEKNAKESLQPQGSFVAKEHLSKSTEGSYIISANYTDKGGAQVGPLSSRAMLVLRHPKVQAEGFKQGRGVTKTDNGMVVMNDNSHIAFENIDLTSIEKLTYRLNATGASGKLEVRLDKPDGKAISTIAVTPAPGADAWQEVSAPVSAIQGKHTLYLVFVANKEQNQGNLILDWIYFNKNGQNGQGKVALK